MTEMNERVRIWSLAVITALVYTNSLTNGFTLDDDANILKNPTVTAPSIHGLFTAASNNVFRPISFGTFALNWAMEGAHPFGYHLFNVALHVGVTLLLYLVLKKLLENVAGVTVIAWITALLFAVHPIHTEAVASVTGRSELLAAGFLLGAWLLHLMDAPIASLGCFALALLSKESAVVFAPLMVAGDYVRGKWKAFPRYVSIASMTVLYLAVLWKVQGNRFGSFRITPLDNPLAQLPIGLRMLGALRVAWKYVALQVFPAKLSCDYSYNAFPVDVRSWQIAAAAVCAAGVIGFWVWTLIAKKREWALAGTLYIVAFATTANILVPVGTILGERLAYLPSAGLCLLAVLVARPLLKHNARLAWTVILAVSAVASVRTMVRNQDWRDDFTLFSSDVQTEPRSAKLHAMLGGQCMLRGQWDVAHRELETALHIYPNYPEVADLCGVIEARMGKDQEALQSFQKALCLAERGSESYNSIAMDLASESVKLGLRDDALRLMNEVVENSPGVSAAWSNRAVIYYSRGETGLARRDAITALRLDPTNSNAKRLLSLLP